MKIILRQDVVNVGEEGDIAVVADGYARNFLVPRGLAMVYGKAAVNELEKRRKVIEKKKEEKRKEASSHKEKIEIEAISFVVKAGEKGKLFGSITAQNVVEELAKRGVHVERKRVEIADGALKTVGNHTVKVKLYGGETATLGVSVKSVEEASAVAAPVEVKE